MDSETARILAEAVATVEARKASRTKGPDFANVTDAARIAPEAVAMLSAMWEAAPDGPESVAGQFRAKETALRESHGWPKRFLPEIELTGDRWHEVFREAQKYIANGAFVALFGGRGPGKTQMAAEIARAGYFPDDKGEWNGNRMTEGKTARYVRVIDLFLELRDSGKELATLRKYSECGFLCLDEFQERGETAFENRMVTNLIDKRYGLNKSTLVIANLKREELAAALGPSIIDRMRENGKSFECDWPSFRKPQIINKILFNNESP